MKTIYSGYCSYTYSTLFLDGNLNYMGSIHENDGEWRHEYFNPIFGKVGIDIIRINKLDSLLEDFSVKLENEEIHLSEIDFSFLKDKI